MKKGKLQILYEDDHIIVIDKPSGLFALPDRFRPDLPNVRSILTKKYGEVFIVHRLDQETSGVMVIAKTEESHKELQRNWSEQTTKIYHLFSLRPVEDNGIIDSPITESTTKRGFYKVHSRGKQAQTKYTVLKYWRDYALVECELLTGRTHQIRVHMRHIGAPLLTDKKYGVSEAFYLSQIKRIKIGREEVEKPLINRSSLHARSLEFPHPISQKVIKLESEYPKDFRALMNQLNKNIKETKSLW